MSKVGIIFGITGQDGSYLSELLLEKGYNVWGQIRRSSSFNTSRIDNIFDKLNLVYGDLTDDTSNIKNDYIYLSSKGCDLTNYDMTYGVFKKYNPTHVIHLAAYVGGLYKNMNQKVEMLEKNTLININVLKVCHELNINNVISCLSTCIFPDKTTYPIDENMLHDGKPHCSNDAYAYSKRLLDTLSKSYREEYNRNYTCIIPTNIYGENDNYSLEDGHVIPALIHKAYLAKKIIYHL